MERIGTEIRTELARLPGAPGTTGVAAVWEEVVGPAVARNAWPGRVGRDGTLHVATSSAAWAFELSQLAPTLLAGLRDALGDASPTAVRFAPGRIPEPARVVTLAPGEHREPTEESRRQAAELTASIADEELRAHIRNAAALSLSSRFSGRSIW
jgi:hypothetical protein